MQVESLHGGLDKQERQSVMHAFHSGQTRAMIVSDIAARGLDFPVPLSACRVCSFRHLASAVGFRWSSFPFQRSEDLSQALSLLRVSVE